MEPAIIAFTGMGQFFFLYSANKNLVVSILIQPIAYNPHRKLHEVILLKSCIDHDIMIPQFSQQPLKFFTTTVSASIQYKRAFSYCLKKNTPGSYFQLQDISLLGNFCQYNVQIWDNQDMHC